METDPIQQPAFTIVPLQPAGELPPAAVLDEILQVYRRCEDFLALGPVPRASLQMVLDDLAHSRQEGGRFCAIRRRTDGEMLGIVDYVSAGFEGDQSAGFLSLLMIAAPHRGQGLGEAVVRAVEAEIRRDPRVKTIFSGVQANNPRAVRFWQRMGYEIISGPELLPDGTTCYRLRSRG